MTTSNESAGVYPSVSDYSDYVVATAGTKVGIVGGATKGELSKLVITDLPTFYKKLGKPVANDYGLLCAEQVLKAKGTVIFKRIAKIGTYATAGNSTNAVSFQAKTMGALNGATVVISDLDTSTGTKFKVVLNDNKGTPLETYENVNLDTASPDFISTRLSSSEHITVAISKGVAVEETTLTFSGGSLGASKAVSESAGIKFATLTYDSTMNQGTVEFSDLQADGYINFIVTNPAGVVLETLTSLSESEDDPRYFVNMINEYSEYVSVSYDKSKLDSVVATKYVLGGGRDGIDGITSAEITEGINAFSNQEEELVKVLTAPGYTKDPAIAKLLDSVASGRDDCIALIDPPPEIIGDAQKVVDWTNGSGVYLGKHDPIGTKDSACYAPWMTMYNGSVGANVHVPPSVLVASVYVQNDKIGHEWTAPAGLNRGKLQTTVTLDKYYNQAERDILYGGRNCVNPIIKFYNEGIVVWGQKTMQRNSTSLDRLNVARVVKYLKNALKLKSAYFVFEGSIQSIWDRWVLTVEPLLEEVKLNQGLYDYRVEMSYGTTITESNLVNHIMPGVIKLLPTQTAEIIPIDFRLYSGGIEFPEE